MFLGYIWARYFSPNNNVTTNTFISADNNVFPNTSVISDISVNSDYPDFLIVNVYIRNRNHENDSFISNNKLLLSE